MDLSFTRFDKNTSVALLSPDLAVLMVGIAARQASSETAAVHARIERAPIAGATFAPVHGAFNAAVAAAFEHWQEA